jgi:hypothetical protein
VGRRVISLTVATTLALALPGCKKEEDPPAASAGSTKAPEAKAEAAGEAAAKKAPEVAIDPSGFTDPAVSYPSALDDLLDLVPAGEGTYAVLRDPNAVLSLFGTLVADQVEGLAPLAKTAEPEVGAKLEQSAALYAKLGDELAKGVINLDKGMVWIGSAEAVIYGANDPNALPNLLRTLGAEQLPDKCIALAGAPGYAACGDDEAKVKAIAPAKKSAELRAALVAALPGFDIERGNLAGQLSPSPPRGELSDGAPLRFAVATPPGSLHAAVGVGELVGDQADVLGTGKPSVLGISDPGSAFLWVKLDTAALKPWLDSMGPPLDTVGATFAGEVYAGGVQGGVPLAVLLGVTDPYPASGLISLASAMIDQVPKELPDGTKVEVKIEKMQAGGKEVPVLHGKLSGSQPIEQLAAMGITGEAFAFAAGKFAAVVIGANEGAVKTIAEAGGGAPTQAQLERLPAPMARALHQGAVSWALHVPLDGMQAPQMQEQIAEGAALVPERERGGLEPNAFANAMLSVIAPLSSLSAWMTHPDDARVVHFAVEGFADDSTAKGKAAREAVAKVTAGGDRKEIYGALASEHPDPRFAARSGADPTALRSALSGAFMLGMLVALAVPAVDEIGSGVAIEPPPPLPPPRPPEPPPPPAPP